MTNIDSNERALAYQRAHPDKTLSSQLKTRYGITLDDYLVLKNKQDDKCAICGPVAPDGRKKRLSVDHCHETGIVRGLLCTRCNTALGWFENHKQKVQEYLENHG